MHRNAWNVRSINQIRLEVVKQEMAGLNIDIWGISGIKWPGMGKFNSDKNDIHFISVQFSRSVVSDCLQCHELQCARPPCPTLTPGGYSSSCPSCQWRHPTISSSVIPVSSRLQYFPSKSQLFPSGGQSIGASASTTILPMNIQDWFPLGWTGWISLQSKGLSRVFSNTTVQKRKFLGTWLYL